MTMPHLRPARLPSMPSPALDFAHGVRQLLGERDWRQRLVIFERLWRAHGAAVAPLGQTRLPAELHLALAVMAPAETDYAPTRIAGLVAHLGARAEEVVRALAAMADRHGVPDPVALQRLADRCPAARPVVMQALADSPGAREASLLGWLVTAERPLALRIAAWLTRFGSAASLAALRAVRLNARAAAPETLSALRRAEAEIRVRTYSAAAGRVAALPPRLAADTVRRSRRLGA